MDHNELENSLKSIGKKSFVDDFEIYSNSSLSTKDKGDILAGKYSVNGAKIRVSFAEKVFLKNMQKTALNSIIASPRIDNDTKVKAKKILSIL
jgi:hypothetical protein